MAEWKTTASVAVIGGGIMGICTAFHLARRGQKDVVLFERDLLAQASTGLCVGGVRQQFSHPANILLSQETVRVFTHFAEEFGVDIGFRQVGYLFLAQTEETWEDFVQSVGEQRRLGVPAERLTPDEIKHRWPYLEVTDLRGGTFCAEDGYADPSTVAMAFAASARRLGVRIFEKTRVTGIRHRSHRVHGLETTQGSIDVPCVVNTAGPWAREVMQMAGLDTPVLPYRRQVFRSLAAEAVPGPVPMILDADELFYFRGDEPGLLMGMSDRDEPPGFNTNVDWGFRERVVAAALHRAPVLEQARLTGGWGGLYAITPDENPVIGPVPGVEGLYCAIGFSGHGFQHGPPVGRILSELILDGRSSFDLFPFQPERFARAAGPAEKRVV